MKWQWASKWNIWQSLMGIVFFFYLTFACFACCVCLVLEFGLCPLCSGFWVCVHFVKPWITFSFFLTCVSTTGYVWRDLIGCFFFSFFLLSVFLSFWFNHLFLFLVLVKYSLYRLVLLIPTYC
ncbi:hypothetical protein B0T19DRAFT_52276 [Cercophora scortea]|uniref:Uncharacterized protein n=1 Tax=Cercophora scortea TaxID=314031 RepID=A0AAE0MLR6_9PEZI|nr:hypothetical protein B0T19DRAFT_52276 [Cercophora scortea]